MRPIASLSNLSVVLIPWLPPAAGGDYDLNARVGGSSVYISIAAVEAHSSHSSFHIPDIYVAAPPLAESSIIVTTFARDQFGNP